MSPTGSKTGWRSARITIQLGIWAERDGAGLVFDSKTGFILPKGPSGRRMLHGRPPVCLENPDSVSADPVLPGFELRLTERWQFLDRNRGEVRFRNSSSPTGLEAYRESASPGSMN